MRSMPAIDVPPNFITMRGMVGERVLGLRAAPCYEVRMAETSTSEGPAGVATSILPKEVRQFASHASDWWDPDGPEAMLHKLNPVRLKYIRDRIDQHWQCDERVRRPLEGKTALDVGCGAGLLAEPLARLGATVT